MISYILEIVNQYLNRINVMKVNIVFSPHQAQSRHVSSVYGRCIGPKQAFLHGETMPRKNHDHDPYFPSFTIAWSMVTDHSLPNGQVNGHGHPRISPQWSGQWLLPSRIAYRISKI